ncbi:GNAT family N-acetyltransferase [Nakamurella deserti]|uniref:GNAT family N-acetyltransferase n=1 Tax=Nakamurella deserti TaxID=2164074 RepID=UPI000DBE83AC|nr:GNAT family N-acetyltransferase [Nakamurella deserti]
MDIRVARPDDAAAILEIHNAAVTRSTAIFTDRLETLAERQAYLADHAAAGHTVLVAEVDDRVVGYASFGTWRKKNGYRLTVDDSVYVRDGHQGAGIGSALLTALVARARAAGFHVMVADIEAGNAGSIRLHERLGFEVCGSVRQVGTKYGRWLDITIMQLLLDPGQDAPAG